MSGEELFLGLDIGSTTAKVVVLDHQGTLLFCRYERHCSQVRACVADLVRATALALPGKLWHVCISGSGGMNLAKALEGLGVTFLQEVMACGLALRHYAPDVDVAIELGGEDAKITFLSGGSEQRMNETCAGGTGAFIDQMASFLNTDAAGLNELASRHRTLYPIASRCGVFAKTDILPLINDGCAREDIAASILQAVVEQTISGLACGRDIKGKVAFLGGPLAFLPELGRLFVQTLELQPQDALFPPDAQYFVALGTAFSMKRSSGPGCSLDDLLTVLDEIGHQLETHTLPPLFRNQDEKDDFLARHKGSSMPKARLEDLHGPAWLGIDCGSTTIKSVLIDENGALLHDSYGANKGNPLGAALNILRNIEARMPETGYIAGSAVTGYGSALLKAALHADIDEVETVAHCRGARFFQPQADLILDIGGQDIKCLHLRQGAIDRIQLNEACSAGCGSFVETFALSLGMDLPNFIEEAISAAAPVDLGTRCTVFMNSKVKQAQKEGAKVGDIAAGLAYSVIRNALYKVINIKHIDELGQKVVAQGGAFRNDALLRALELLLGRKVVRPELSGHMGALGAALIAREQSPQTSLGQSRILAGQGLANFTVHNTSTRCQSCSNNCTLTISRFADGSRFISGNRCEKGAGQSAIAQRLPNLYAYKNDRVFDYQPLPVGKATRGVVGLPRALNMFENYPLWFTLFTELGFRVVLSAPSSKEIFQLGARSLPSQSACYPAKLVHGHILNLLFNKQENMDFMFMPCIQRELQEFPTQNDKFNCPVVGGYPEILSLNIQALQDQDIPLYTPFLPLDEIFLPKRLQECPPLAKISLGEIQKAVSRGFAEWNRYKQDMRKAGEEALKILDKQQAFGVVLCGHPYHADPEVHHGIAELVTACGMGVLSEDSVAHLMPDPGPLRVVDQWTYHARLYRAGSLAASRNNLAVLQLVSFGCGLDAITSVQLEELVSQKGKLYAQIKIDEGSNLGPARIRIRSLLAALKERRLAASASLAQPAPICDLKPFTPEMRATHTLLIPQMSPMHFQFSEAIFTASGYKVSQLPKVSRAAMEKGLRHVHNDACFPAITVIGQLLEAIESGEFSKDAIALIMSQTGGGCRATNYIGLLRRALESCNLHDVPVISTSMQGLESNPGFKLTYPMVLRICMAGYYGDVLIRVLNRVRPYEKAPGSANALAEKWAEKAKKTIARAFPPLFHLDVLHLVRDFDRLPLRDEPRRPRVGLVGEILLKYHPDANNNAPQIIEDEGGEAVIPDLMDFMFYCLYDEIWRYRHAEGQFYTASMRVLAMALLEAGRSSMRWALSHSQRFDAPLRFRALKKKVNGLVSLGQQTGEGWLLTAEMVELVESGVPNILCLQPFGCLPNHITGKGVMKELKRRYPQANLVAVDYDPGASEVNQINRIKLMMALARAEGQ